MSDKMSDSCSILVRMSASVSEPQADPALALLTAAVDGLQNLNLTAPSDEQLLDVLRELEAQKRRLAAVDHALIAEIEARGVARERGCAKSADLLVAVLRIAPGDANTRVRAATELGPRRSLTGAALPPLFAAAAAASTQGVISPAHARVITNTITKLPAAVAVEHDTSIEAFLVEQATQHNPRTLKVIARRLLDTLHPDGTLATEHDRHRHRHLTIQQRPDGSGQVTGELDAICTEALLTVLDTLARPTPAEDGQPDRRTAAQRRHDGLRDSLLTLIRSDQLPACGGVSTTILLTLTADQLQTRTGLVRTGHGALISTTQALTLLGDAQIQPIALGTLKQITAYGHTHRIFTQNQRLAMTARDQGCSFPGCTVPPPGAKPTTSPTTASPGTPASTTGTLLCGHHHREHHKLGWKCHITNGIPHWTPPPWTDPTQTPRRNHAHDPHHVHP